MFSSGKSQITKPKGQIKEEFKIRDTEPGAARVRSQTHRRGLIYQALFTVICSGFDESNPYGRLVARARVAGFD